MHRHSWKPIIAEAVPVRKLAVRESDLKVALSKPPNLLFGSDHR
jgi:hypothetical protein